MKGISNEVLEAYCTLVSSDQNLVNDLIYCLATKELQRRKLKKKIEDQKTLIPAGLGQNH
jgi:hypothetical protein